ncbi:conserved hypothetical protein [delta proteobacterium NaphS2]|nr:conserved hypothetical protein [delta proteobacterium NaphS2]
MIRLCFIIDPFQFFINVYSPIAVLTGAAIVHLSEIIPNNRIIT